MYKASRRREYERLRLMDEEVKREEADTRFEREREEKRRRDEEKTLKNRMRREKKKEKRGKGGGKGGEEAEKGGLNGAKPKIKVQGPPRPSGNDMVESGDDGDDGMEGIAAAPVTEEVGVVIHDDD